MDKRQKSKDTTPAKVVSQARIDVSLAVQVQELSRAAGDDSTSDFVRRAIENEVSRATLCSPAKVITQADLNSKLGQILDAISAQEALARLNSELLKSLCQAVGTQAS